MNDTIHSFDVEFDILSVCDESKDVITGESDIEIFKVSKAILDIMNVEFVTKPVKPFSMRNGNRVASSDATIVMTYSGLRIVILLSYDKFKIAYDICKEVLSIESILKAKDK
jgi:hypothetical protein